ncbi:hypothetical protein STEG23_009712, partial [Scotinomys teguina]
MRKPAPSLGFNLVDMSLGWNLPSSAFFKAGFVDRCCSNLVLSWNVLFTPTMVIESFARLGLFMVSQISWTFCFMTFLDLVFSLTDKSISYVSTKVTIRGAKACVEAAKKHIQEIFEPLHSQVTTRCAIPLKYHPCIMGPICSRIQQIARDCKIPTKFPVSEKATTNTHQENGEEKGEKITEVPASTFPNKIDTISLSDKAETCTAATQALESPVPFTAKVQVPFHLHPYIIGHRGSELHKLIKEFEVHIQVSQPGGNFHTISIMGLEANVEQAKVKLKNQVKALQMEIGNRTLRRFRKTFKLDPKYHSKIFGNKGILLSQICTECDVTIRFSNKVRNTMQDQITISGSKDNILRSQDAIIKLLCKIEKTVSKEVPLNHQVCSNIIGYGAQSIHNIMEQFQVDIHVPSKGICTNSSIVVSGPSCNVQDAIEYILTLEKYFLFVRKDEPPLEHVNYDVVGLCIYFHQLQVEASQMMAEYNTVL